LVYAFVSGCVNSSAVGFVNTNASSRYKNLGPYNFFFLDLKNVCTSFKTKCVRCLLTVSGITNSNDAV
jgi:hypothetical protein